MSDIVERLNTAYGVNGLAILRTASDTITALREEVERLQSIVNNLSDLGHSLTADNVCLRAALERARTVLGHMALENEGAIFNRWPISHEPLRLDAKNLLPVIDTALTQEKPDGPV